MFLHSKEKLDELKLCNAIFKRDEMTEGGGSQRHIINKMNPYINARGEKIVTDENLLNDPTEFTMKLLELKKEMDDMVEYSFAQDMKFQKARDSSFMQFMNECSNTPAYIAQFCDVELKKGLKGASE
jgi:uncharacterized membrane-anchored protein